MPATRGDKLMLVLDKTVSDMLDHAAAHQAERIGWVFEDEAISFAAMRQRSDEVARALLALGIGKGDVIGLWMPNLPEFAYLQFAAARIGAIAAAINTRSKSSELAHVLAQGDVKALFMVGAFLKHDFLATLRDVLGASPAPDGSVRCDHLPCLRRVASVGAAMAGGLAWSRFIAGGASMQFDDRQHVSPQDPLLLQYTSGTTAKPKGALLNHVYVLNYGVEFITRMGIQAGEAYMNTQPFYHVGGSCAALPVPLMIGVKMVSAAYYTPERILELIERESCVGRSGYAAMYLMEMASADFGERDIACLRAGWCVGSKPVLGRIKDAMRLRHLFQIYAATEGGGTSGRWDEPWEMQSETCGTPLEGTQIRILGSADSGADASPVIGEILLRGPIMMNGYYKMPEATRAAIDADGWLHTGDLGFLDAAGHLHFVGRAKDMLKVGGENVAAEEVEAVLLAHPDVRQASVIGFPDDRLGEVVLAVVEPRDDRLSEQDIMEYCRPRLANFRVPKQVRFTRDWPMTALGKIQKTVLRERYAPG
jgi:fatty-acyl-CoA synthase/long-chain acyl-CoA synthetase